MKISKITFLISLFCLLLTGCSGNSPEGIAKEFCEAIYRGNFKKAKSFCTPQSAAGMDFGLSMMKDEDLKERKSAQVEANVIDCYVSEDGESAQVTVEVKVNDVKRKEEISLEKIDGKWKVVCKIK